MSKAVKYILILAACFGVVFLLKWAGCVGKPPKEVPVHTDSAVLIKAWRDAWNRDHQLIKTIAVEKETLRESKDATIDSLRKAAEALGIKLRNMKHGTIIGSTTKDTAKIPVFVYIRAYHDTTGIHIPFVWSDSFTRINGNIIASTMDSLVRIDSVDMGYVVKNSFRVIYGEKRLKWWHLKKVPVVGLISENPNTENKVIDVEVTKKKWWQTDAAKIGAGAGIVLLLFQLL